MSEREPVDVKRQPSERTFTEDVIETAHRHGWQSFHLRDRDSIHIVRGRGFPDLVMFRKDTETGSIELVAAELKRNYTAELGDEQQEWLSALGQHFPAFTWRPDDWDDIERVLIDGPKTARSVSRQPSEPLGESQIPRNIGKVIQGIAETIESKEFELGDRSKLRRMDYNRPDTAAFWRLMARKGIPRNPDLSKWGLIVHGMALMAHGAGLAHRPSHSVGRVLYEGGGNRVPFYSDDRLATLLSAEGPTLHRLLARLFRMLASERCSFNWREMAWFILNEGWDRERTNEARHKMAQAYYRAESINRNQAN